jgi:hypothetical protein
MTDPLEPVDAVDPDGLGARLVPARPGDPAAQHDGWIAPGRGARRGWADASRVQVPVVAVEAMRQRADESGARRRSGSVGSRRRDVDGRGFAGAAGGERGDEDERAREGTRKEEDAGCRLSPAIRNGRWGR